MIHDTSRPMFARPPNGLAQYQTHLNTSTNNASWLLNDAMQLSAGATGSTRSSYAKEEASSIDVDAAVKITPFKSLDSVPFDVERWQSVGLLKKKGVFLVVVPPGACSSALGAYFAAFLSARATMPFGRVWFPGDVLLSSYTEHVQRSIKSSFSPTLQSDGQIDTQVTTRRFNWKAPMVNLKCALADRKKGQVSAIIVDTGTFAQGIDEAVVESAYATLSDMADKADCLILLLIESTSRSADPFERIPRSLRIFRGTLLAVPLVSKVLAHQPGKPAEFLLIRLEETAASALTVRFRLETNMFSNTPSIGWAEVNFCDPRSAFLSAESVDLTTAQRVAVQLASDVIRSRGAMTTAELKTVGRLSGVAPTTMRDALSAAKLLGYLESVRRNDGRSFWTIPSFPHYVAR